MEQTNTNLLAPVIGRLELPKQHLDRNLNYGSHVKMFWRIVESRTNDHEARLSNLIQHCEEVVDDQMRHCTVLEPANG